MSDLTYLEELIEGPPGPPGPPGSGGGGQPLTDVAYVDAAHTGASTGGIGAPFATIAAAIASLGGQGLILLAPGQYAEAAIAVPSGSMLTISSLETTSIPPTIVHQILWNVGDDDELHISGVNLPNGLTLKDADAGTGDVNLRLDSLTSGAIQNGNVGAAPHTHVITVTSTARAFGPTDSTTLGNVAVNGAVYATNTVLSGNVTCSGLFGNYAYLSNTITVTAAGNCVLKNSELGATVSIALGGSGSTLFVDETTDYFTGGLILSGTGANKVVYRNESVTSVFGRTGGITPVFADYTSSLIGNSSSVTSGGASVTSALNSLQTQITGITVPVTSVFGRTGTVAATAGDYTSTLISNSSSVTSGGLTVTTALNSLQSQISAVSMPVTDGSTLTGTTTFSVKAGGITNTQVNASAAIAGSKIDPTFGAQVISTTTAVRTGLASGSGNSVASAASKGSIRGSRGANPGTGSGTGFTAYVRNDADNGDVQVLGWDSTANIFSIGRNLYSETAPDAVVLSPLTTLQLDAGSQTYFTLGGSTKGLLSGNEWNFQSCDLVTEGIVQAPQIGDGTTNVLVHASSFRTDCIGNFIGLGQSFAVLNNGSSTDSGSLPQLTISATSGSGSATHKAGNLLIVAGSTSSANGTGGDLMLSGGDGLDNTHNGNITIHLFQTDMKGMERGIWIGEATAIPTGNPGDGFFFYVDPADHKLKARGKSGTVTTIANP